MRTLLPLLVSATLFACADTERADPPGAGPAADPYVQAALEGVRQAHDPGGAWATVRYAAFDRVVGDGDTEGTAVRWDRQEGRARVELMVDGALVLALFDRDDDAEGQAWRNGTALDGDSARVWLERARALHDAAIQDLFLPFLLTGDAAVVRAAPDAAPDGTRVLDAVLPGSATPLRILVDADGRGIVGTASAAEMAQGTRWTRVEQVAGLRLAAERIPADGPAVRYENVELAAEPPPGAFDPPGALRRP